MPNQHTQIARVILILLTFAGLIPAALIIYGWIAGGSGAEVAQWLSHPALPAVFLLLFVLGAGICIYLANRWFLILLLPLLYLALVPLFIDGMRQQPQTFYGQTMPGEGFALYGKNGWKIQIKYAEPVAKAVQNSGKIPIVMASLGGESDHWYALGSNSIYPFKDDSQEIAEKNWYQGFELYFSNKIHTHTVKKKKTSAGTGRVSLDTPKKAQWFVSYVIVIPED